MARLGILLVLALHLLAVAAPLLSTHDPNALGDPVLQRAQAPSPQHWMGTDFLGRDLYSRVVHGAQISLWIANITVVLNLAIGLLVGVSAGFAGGALDAVLMRLTDLLLAFPRVFLLLALLALYSPSVLLIIAVLGLTGWMGIARVVRAEVLRAKQLEFVQAARALGFSRRRIVWRHVLPAALSPVIALAALRVGNTILTESFLSFLGFGVSEPQVSWGLVIRGGRTALLDAWWIATFPGLAIVVCVVGYNLLGDALRDLYDPRLMGEREVG
jgi:peptide/nickel transport system permease protein